MKSYKWLAVLVAGLSWNAGATLFTYNWSVGTAIPDANPSGYVNNQTIGPGGLPDNPYIVSMAVNLNLSGGWNGDLYGYLRYDDGNGHVGFTVLLNRVGVGESGAGPMGWTTPGMDVWLTDSTGTDIHTVQTPTGGGTYQVDQSVSGGNPGYASFVDLDPTVGTWSLFLADMSGGNVSTLESWGLEINVVPEPITWALVIFGGVLGIVGLARSKPVRNRIERWRVAVNAWLNAA